MTAKLAEDVGFEALYLRGYVVGSSIAASEPLTTMTEMCDRAGEITAATDLPLIVDGDAGFGIPSHTHRMIRQYNHPGVDTLHIEDQVYPKRMHYFATEDRQGRKHIDPGRSERQSEADTRQRTARRPAHRRSARLQ